MTFIGFWKPNIIQRVKKIMNDQFYRFFVDQLFKNETLTILCLQKVC